MVLVRDPFKPTFGADPPLLVGRDETITLFANALDDGPGSAGRATLYTGARGSGKTVMLNAAEFQARQRGWLVVSETASRGFVERVADALRVPEHLGGPGTSGRRRIASVEAPILGGGVGFEHEAAPERLVTLRSALTDTAAALAEHGTGILITLDEIHRTQIDELRDFAVALQHAFREDLDVAFVGAGLAAAISDVLQDEVLTFLRRADRQPLEDVEIEEVRRALAEPVAAGGRQLAEDALTLMAEGTRGYPFLIQLIGSHVWNVDRDAPTISLAHAQLGVTRAQRRLGALVHAPALTGLSAIDKSFLVAMAKDEGPSLMADIQSRLGVDTNYASQYRLRLIDAELIEPAGRGKVAFTLPFLPEYLREHVSADV
jgi:hypothetical protein